MPVSGGAVLLLFRLQQPPRRDQLRTLRNKILTDRVGCILAPDDCIRYMRNAEPLHDAGGDHLVERLLPERVAAALDQASLPIDDLPPLFQIAVRCAVGGAEIECVLLLSFSEQHISDVLREIILEKVDVLPPKLRAFRTDPVLIREAQPVAADEQHFGVCHPQRFQCFPHTAAACRNRAIPPPVVKRRTVGDLVSHRDADRQMLRCVDTAYSLYKAGHIVQLELCHGGSFMHKGAFHTCRLISSAFL